MAPLHAEGNAAAPARWLPPGLAPASHGPQAYDSKFVNWEARASVRTKPERTFVAQPPSTLFFPPELVPAFRHPALERLDPGGVHRLLVHSLYNYLYFTVTLEQLAVLPITARISVGKCGVTLPDAMRADAFKITTDEAWHAQFSHAFIDQVAAQSGIAFAPPERLQFADRLDGIRASFEPGRRPLVDLFFATVSETLVSAFLAVLPNDRRLPRPVRELVTDHAEDEGRHHAYFRAFLRFAWPQLSAAEQRLIGPRVPEFVTAFLEPDAGAAAAALRQAGLDERTVAEVVADCYLDAEHTEHVVSASRATVHSFREVGALDDPCTHEAFAAHGLVG